jgi:hypothetical protein
MTRERSFIIIDGGDRPHSWLGRQASKLHNQPLTGRNVRKRFGYMCIYQTDKETHFFFPNSLVPSDSIFSPVWEIHLDCGGGSSGSSPSSIFTGMPPPKPAVAAAASTRDAFESCGSGACSLAGFSVEAGPRISFAMRGEPWTGDNDLRDLLSLWCDDAVRGDVRPFCGREQKKKFQHAVGDGLSQNQTSKAYLLGPP